MIRFHEVWHHYGVRPTLVGINLQVSAGELVCLMGPNGSGKTTALGVAGGVLPPMKGHVEINGRKRRGSVEDERAIRQQTCYMPDQPWLPEGSTGREFLVAVGRLYDVPMDRLFTHIDQLLKVFDLGDYGDRPIDRYSTGQKKKIGLCSGLVTEAPVLILDEPLSGGLDASALLAMEHILKALADRNDVTVLMAVPVPELVDRIADRVAVIKDGKILAQGSPSSLCEQTGRDSLAEALDLLTHPDRPKHLARYLARETP